MGRPWIEILAIIAYVAVLVLAIILIANFYICDAKTCRAFKDGLAAGPVGSKEYTLAVLNELFQDGTWPIAYIGASIWTPLTLWFIEAPINVRNFAIVFFVTFAVSYFVLAFIIHHYVKFIVAEVTQFIQTNTLVNGPIGLANNGSPFEENLILLYHRHIVS